MYARDAKAQRWRRRLDEQLASGLSVALWCRNNGCRRQSFYYWQSRLEHRGTACPQKSNVDGSASCPREAQPTREAMDRFVELVDRLPAAGPLAPQEPLAFGPLAGEPLRLRLAGGRELLLPASMPTASLAQLLRALEGSCAPWARGQS